MTISSALASAWNDVEQAHRTGHISNQSLLAFVMSEPLRRALPKLQITYDGRQMPEQRSQPNLLIWHDADIPKIQFMGYLRLGDISERTARLDARKLWHAVKKPSHSILIHDPQNRRYEEREIKIASDCECGLFLMGYMKGAGDLQKLLTARPAKKRIRFHLGVGALDKEGLLAASFHCSKLAIAGSPI